MSAATMEAGDVMTRAMAWIAGDDTGMSSKTIWRHMMGVPHGPMLYPNGVAIPDDPDDFGRCYRLLMLIPEWQPRMGEMVQYADWRPLVREWPKLMAMYTEVEPVRRQWNHDASRRMYAVMRELRAEAGR